MKGLIKGIKKLNASGRMRKERFFEYFIVIICILAGSLNLFYNKKIENIYRSPDSRVYLGIAQGLVHKEGYKKVYEKYNWQFPAPYPPLYPFLLAVLFKLSPTDKDLMTKVMIFHFLIYCLTALAVYWLARKLLGNNLYAIFTTLLFICNHLVLYYFFVALTEGPFFLCFIFALYFWSMYKQKTSSTLLLVIALLFASMASYTRAIGIVLLGALLLSDIPYLKITKEKFWILCSFIPVVSFYFHWWLFTGSPGRYFTTGSFFYNKDIAYLKFMVSETIFYIPFKLMFYYCGIDNLDFFFRPLVFIGRTTRIDLAGITSLTLWLITFLWCVKLIRSKQFIIPLIFLLSVFVYIQHTCFTCNDPRVLLMLLPFLIVAVFELFLKIKNLYLKHLVTTLFVVVYIVINAYVAFNNSGF